MISPFLSKLAMNFSEKETSNMAVLCRISITRPPSLFTGLANLSNLEAFRSATSFRSPFGILHSFSSTIDFCFFLSLALLINYSF